MARKITKVDVATNSLHSVERVVEALGATIVDRQSTPGAVGYTTLTINQED